MLLKQSDFLHATETRSVLQVDPKNVDTTIGSKWPVGKRRIRQLSKILPAPLVAMLRPAIKHREPFVIPRDAFPAPTPVAATRRYMRVADLLRHRTDPARSLWHADLMAELNSSGVARHKSIEMRSEAEIAAFFDTYVMPLVESLERDGFRPDIEGYVSTAVIGPEGEIIKTGSGNHRFCIARELGLPEFPLKVVGAHEEWVSRTLGPAPSRAAVLDALSTLAGGPPRG